MRICNEKISRINGRNLQKASSGSNTGNAILPRFGLDGFHHNIFTKVKLPIRRTAFVVRF